MPYINLVKGNETNSLEKEMFCRKVKLHPKNMSDTRKLLKYFGIVRWCYNQGVSVINDDNYKEIRNSLIEEEGKKGQITWKKFLRALIINKDSSAVKENPWLEEVGYDIKDGAISDLLSSMKACWTNMNKGNIDNFQIKYKSRKRNKSESLFFRRRWIQRKGNNLILKWPKSKPMVLKITEDVDVSQILCDCRLQRTWDNSFYLCIPYERKDEDVVMVDNQDQIKYTSSKIRVAAIDPGVRVFNTIFDVNNSCAYSVGDGDKSRLFRLAFCLDNLCSKISKENNKKIKRDMIRASKRLRNKIRLLVDEVHKQLA